MGRCSEGRKGSECREEKKSDGEKTREKNTVKNSTRQGGVRQTAARETDYKPMLVGVGRGQLSLEGSSEVLLSLMCRGEFEG